MPTSIQILIDKDEIRDLLFSYCRSVDRLDAPLGHGVFHEDSHVDYGEGVYQGPGRGLIDLLCEGHRQFIAHSHQISNILISVDGDKAGSEAYVTATLRSEQDGRQLRTLVRARYIDAWEKRQGRWGIVRRVVALDHDEICEVRPMMGTLNSTRDRSDPSYLVLKGKSRRSRPGGDAGGRAR